MLYLINPQFINVEKTTVTDKDNVLEKYRFKTIETVSVKTKKPFFRYLATLTGSNEAPGVNLDFFAINPDEFCIWECVNGVVPSVSPNENKPGQNNVNIRTMNVGEERADTVTVIMAIPFSGILKQIPKSKDYRILTGCIVRSSEGITFGNREYTSVLYLVMTMNPALYDKNHKFHKEKAELVVQSYQIPSGASGNIECTIETTVVEFHSENGIVYLDTNETLDCQINVEEVLDIHPTWFTYRPTNKKGVSKTSSNASKDKKTSKPSKEYKEASRKSESKLDEMIKKSNADFNKGGKHRYSDNKPFSFEESFDDGRPKSKRKGNKGKKGKNKRRYDDYE